MKIRIPVCDLRVTLLPAWSASMKQFIWMAFPLGGGAFKGKFSFAPR
jgi:hypothetical protein